MSFKAWFPAVLLAAVISAPLRADEPPAPTGPPAPPNDMRRDESRRGERFQGMLNSLKEKYPGEVAEIEKLMQTDRRAAMQKMRELMPRSFPGGFGNRDRSANGPWQVLMQQLKEKFPAEYAEIEKLMQTDRTAAIAKLRELATKAGLTIPEGEPGQFRSGNLTSPRNRNRLMSRAAEKIVQQLYPEEYELMLEMRKTDPDAAREMFRGMVREAGLTQEDLEKTVARGQSRIRSVVFTDKELEEQYEQAAGNTPVPPWGGGFPGRGGFRPR